MSDTFLPGSGFDTYEQQDKVLVGLGGGTAADKLGIQYIATGHFAQVETGADGISHIYPPEDPAQDESDALAALPQDILARLILPLGSFTPEDVQEMAADFNV